MIKHGQNTNSPCGTEKDNQDNGYDVVTTGQVKGRVAVSASYMQTFLRTRQGQATCASHLFPIKANYKMGLTKWRKFVQRMSQV